MTETDTIAAIATPLGRGGIGIVRMSGPRAEEIVSCLFAAQNNTPAAEMETHRLYLGEMRDAAGRLLDTGLAVLMRAPHSYTTEDVAEFQLHGGPRVLGEALRATLAAGARLATPGEFTLRAFVNGRLDLSQAEAVLDIIEAKTPLAAELAAGQLSGKLAGVIAELEARLTGLLARVSVGVDFPDDAEAAESEEIVPALNELLDRLDNGLLRTARQGRVWREGLRTALVGAVNVGKSSLLNRLLAEDRAIVTALPGTTRDIIEETLEVNGVPLILVDTAGFRERDAADAAERLGIERSRKALEAAQLTLVVLDATVGLDATARRLLTETAGRPRLAVINKCDAGDAAALRSAVLSAERGELAAAEVVVISALEGTGEAELSAAILRKAGVEADAEAGSALINNARHEQALLRARESLRMARAGLAAGVPVDIAAIDMENALLALGEISGKTASEEVLREIFSRFCVGK